MFHLGQLKAGLNFLLKNLLCFQLLLFFLILFIMKNDFLSSNQENILNLVNNISQMIMVGDSRGKLFWYNKRWKEYTASEGNENDWISFYHPDDQRKIKSKLKISEAEKKMWEGTFQIKDCNGNYNYFLSRAEPDFNEKTKELRWFITNTQVNRLVKLEKEIKNEKSLLQTVIDKIPAMVIIYDPESMQVKLNQAFENCIGWTNEDANKGNIMELVCPDQEYRKEVQSFIQKCGPFFKDIEMTTKDGSILQTSWANERVDDGRQVGIGIDITDRKKIEGEIRSANEQLLSLNQLMENLLHMAAHDLKSPIANLNLIMTLMEDETEDEEKLSYLPKVSTMVNRLEGVVDGLSEFIESQQQQADLCTKVDLNKLSENTLADFSEEIKEQSIVVKKDFKVETINFDYSVLQIILKNLISNAVKYTSNDKNPEIIIRWYTEGDFVILQVEDNGIGINLQKYGNNLFKPFKRFSSKAWGSGIGLFIAKNLIERNGGFIEVKSEPNAGSTFKCYLKECKI